MEDQNMYIYSEQGSSPGQRTLLGHGLGEHALNVARLDNVDAQLALVVHQAQVSTVVYQHPGEQPCLI